jgi:hypothetical protein
VEYVNFLRATGKAADIALQSDNAKVDDDDDDDDDDGNDNHDYLMAKDTL